MGTGEDSTPSKPSKTTTSTQEIPATPSYPDWSNSMQAYYGAGTPPPFFASTVTSPTPHPYLWGSQHPLMPPYGTPVPYPALYPPGGVYAHHNIAATPASVPINTELEGKGLDGKDKASTKKSKGTPGGNIAEKAASGSGNNMVSQSAESGSDSSSDASDENNNRQDIASSKKKSFNQMLADANAQNNTTGPNIKASVPATNLNVGMDLWNASPVAAPGAVKMRPNPAGTSSATVPTATREQWIQDERELKRQKRKQSNRESARRSRLRKQAECEELLNRVENLSQENSNLKDDVQRLSEECEKLKSENDSIKEELMRLYGTDAVANLESNPSSVQSRGEGTG